MRKHIGPDAYVYDYVRFSNPKVSLCVCASYVVSVTAGIGCALRCGRVKQPPPPRVTARVTDSPGRSQSPRRRRPLARRPHRCLAHGADVGCGRCGGGEGGRTGRRRGRRRVLARSREVVPGRRRGARNTNGLGNRTGVRARLRRFRILGSARVVRTCRRRRTRRRISVRTRYAVASDRKDSTKRHTRTAVTTTRTHT